MAPSLKTDAERIADSIEIIRKKNAEIVDLKRNIAQITRENDTAEAIRQEIYGLAAHSMAPPQ